MNLYLRSSLLSVLNTPLAMHESYAMALRAALMGDLHTGARVRGQDNVPEIDVQRAMAAMSGVPTDSMGRAIRPYQLSSSGIAFIEILGPLVRSADIWDRIFGGVYSYDDLTEQVLFAQSDADCRGIFIHFNTPGGRVDGLYDCAATVFSCSARNGGKPIFGYAGDQACSAGYLLLSACDKGFMSETGQVGSIGTIMLYADMTGMYEQEGIEIVIFRSPSGKAIGTMGAETLPESEMKRRQEQVDYLTGLFTQRVATYVPAMSQAAVAETQGFDYIGPRAKAIGLVNDICSMPDAWAKLERRIAR